MEPSGRMRRTQTKIGTLYAHIADARRDHQHQISSLAVASDQVIAIAPVDVCGLWPAPPPRPQRGVLAVTGRIT